MESTEKVLSGKTILITGAARRLGKFMALAAAQAGADIVLHHAHSPNEAAETARQIVDLGQKAWVVEADLSKPEEIEPFCQTAFTLANINALINNAAIFNQVNFASTSLEEWNQHLQINLTAPFLLSQYFSSHFTAPSPGIIINILDWRALRPGKDHFPYTISKAALAAMTKSLALSLAPEFLVNGIALGAILPPENELPAPDIIANVPMKRWANLDELASLLLFLLCGATYTTGEIIHLDGGRHLN